MYVQHHSIAAVSHAPTRVPRRSNLSIMATEASDEFADAANFGWGSFAVAARGFKKSLEKQLEDYATENERNKKVLESMGNARLMEIAEETSTVEEDGMKYLNAEKQESVKKLRKSIRDVGVSMGGVEGGAGEQPLGAIHARV